MSKLERYIRDHRQQFDQEEPGDELWGRIQAEMKKEVKLKVSKNKIDFWKVAAVILLLFTSGLLYDKWSQPENKATEVESYFTNDFQEAERFYLQLASEKRAILEEKSKNDPEYRKEFLGEIEDLDKQYEQLKSDLRLGNQDEILDAMIINLQLRIEILNRQLEIIENLNKKESENESVNI